MGRPLQCLVCPAASWRSAKLLRPRLAVHIQANLEFIAFECKDPEIPISSFRPFDELDINFMRPGFDIDIEDPFVVRFRRFGAKSIPINEYARGSQTAGGNDAAIYFKARETTAPLKRPKLLHMTCEAGPACEPGLARNR